MMLVSWGIFKTIAVENKHNGFKMTFVKGSLRTLERPAQHPRIQTSRRLDPQYAHHIFHALHRLNPQVGTAA